MSAGSCGAAIRCRRPPQWAHAGTSMPNAPCIGAAQLPAGGLAVFTPLPLPDGPLGGSRSAIQGLIERVPPSLTLPGGATKIGRRREEAE